MPHHRIAIATCTKHPTLTEDDQILPTALLEQGIHAEPVIWDSEVNWKQYSAVAIRSTWDYLSKYDRFLQWIDRLEMLQIKTFNPPSVLRENTHKTYLKKFEKAGIPIVPTSWIEKAKPVTLTSILQKTGWNDFVLKPTVSAGSFRTHRLSASDSSENEIKLQEILSASDAMIQPLIPTIQTEGEYSILFFGGEFSHAVNKRAKAGEFRIHHTFGGTVHPYSPTPEEITQAKAAFDFYESIHLPEKLLYARIDMVRDPQNPSKLLLMEFEATEPQLFFRWDSSHPGAAKRYASALARSLEQA